VCVCFFSSVNYFTICCVCLFSVCTLKCLVLQKCKLNYTVGHKKGTNLFLCVTLSTRAHSVAEMGDRGHNRHGPKRWGATVALSRRAGSRSNTMWHGLRSTSVPSGVFIHPVVWPQRTLDKNWGLCPFRGGEDGSPSNTKSPGLRPTYMPSSVFFEK